MFEIKRIEVDVSHEYIAMLYDEDAKELSLYSKERIKIINPKNGKSVICVLDVIDYDKKKNEKRDINLKKGQVGVFDKAFDKLDLKEGGRVNIIPSNKPKSLEYIKKKLKGDRLSESEFREIVLDIYENRYSEVETTFFVIACSVNKLDDKETISLTRAMIDVGKVLDFKTKDNNIIVDKHCIGGIPGNRTSMLVVPIVAAAGLIIPKSSSRAITSPAGTADTMEVLANVDVPLTKMYKEVKDINCCLVWGGALELSPADDLIIEVEHPLEIDSEGQMLASILSKKRSVGSTHVLIDIPICKQGKVKNFFEAKKLEKRFKVIGKAIGLEIKVVITDGSSPIGNGIGPLYEALDVLSILKNEIGCAKDLKEKSLFMAGQIFEMVNFVKKGVGYSYAKEILESGKAYNKFNEILEYQGKKSILPKAKFSYKFRSSFNGKVKGISNKYVSKLSYVLGAPKDKAAGMILKKHVGDKVSSGDVLFEIFCNSELKLKYAKVYLKEKVVYDIK